MTTKITKDVSRVTNFIDQRTGKPIILTIDEGGKLIHLRAAGDRKKNQYTVAIADIWYAGARNKAVDLKEARSVKRAQ